MHDPGCDVRETPVGEVHGAERREGRFVPLATLRRSLSPTTALYLGQLARSVVAVRRLARAVGAQIIHTNMEVLLEGGLAARSLSIPHVLHYRGNTLDRPKPVFDALL